MQEWIIAMLVISVLLILRDMAKNYFDGENVEKRRNISDWRKSSSERKSGTLCGSFSETCGYILWNAVQKGIPE